MPIVGGCCTVFLIQIMSSIRNLLVLVVVLIFVGTKSRAQSYPESPTTAETEARNETEAPSLSGQVREARRITSFLLDALVLSNVQLQALQACTIAEHAALALALTDADKVQAKWQYQLAVRRVLAPSQLRIYTMLYQQLVGTMLPLDGTELAVR